MDEALLGTVMLMERYQPAGYRVEYDRQKYVFEISLSGIESEKELLTVFNEWGLKSGSYTLVPRVDNGKWCSKIAIVNYQRPSRNSIHGHISFDDNKCKLKRFFTHKTARKATLKHPF